MSSKENEEIQEKANDLLKHGKEVALLVCNEVLEFVPSALLDSYGGDSCFYENDNYTFWESVKKIVENVK
jgi:hypothetical protein